MSILGAPAFVISGSPKVGKTRLAVKLAEELDCPIVSFGDHVRSHARTLGETAPTRRFLQDLGQELVGRDPSNIGRSDETQSKTVLRDRRIPDLCQRVLGRDPEENAA